MNETSQRLCAHCNEVEVSVKGSNDKSSVLCDTCKHLPRCEICEVFFDGLVSASEENPNRCDGCLDFEEFIEFNCMCGKAIPLYKSRKSKILRYVDRGNFCGACNWAAFIESKKAKKEEGEKYQFVGYLKLIENLYNAGAIGKDEWEHAIRMNRHDVTNWDGLDESLMTDDDIYSEELIEETV